MASNPMQKKARNSFLLGMVLTLVIVLIIGVLLVFLVYIPNKEKEEERGKEVVAYVLNQDVTSGSTITTDMLTEATVYESMVPSNYVDTNVIATMLAQNDGTSIIAKLNMNKNTILTTDLIMSSENPITDDVRYVEYNMLVLPTTIAVGDYIDIRLTLPNGQDLIVVSKKQVKSLLGDTVGLELTEGDILMMESAIVEAYIMSASKIYAIQYVEPGNQVAAAETYRPTAAVENLINTDSNITEEAKEALRNKFISGLRGYIDTERNAYIDEQQENLETRLQEEIENARAAREAYLSGLTSY